MQLEDLLSNFQYEDLQWIIPVVAGLVVIVGGLLIGLIRGMTSGLIVALFFGGLLSLSPVLLNALQRPGGSIEAASADVARSAADLAVLNNDAVRNLSRILATMRTSLDTLSPVVTGTGENEAVDPALTQRFNQSLSDMEERLDAAVNALSRDTLLRQRLEEDIAALEAELRRQPRLP